MSLDLKAERLRRGKSVEKLAEQIGVSEYVLRYAEKGGRPHPGNALKIAQFYGVDVIDQWPVEEEAA